MVVIGACVSNEQKSDKKESDSLKAITPESMYNVAQSHFDNKQFMKCMNEINRMEVKFPNSQLALKAKELHDTAKIEYEKLIVELQILRMDSAKNEEKKHLEEKKRNDKILSKLRKTYDDVENINWYYDKTTPKFTNIKSFHVYMGQRNSGKPWLRLRIQYTADDWLFTNKYIIKADDETYTINEESYGEIKSDNGSGGIWEWLDREISSDELIIIRAIIKSKQAKLRYSGDKYYSDKIISDAEKKAMQNVLDAFEVLGGEY